MRKIIFLTELLLLQPIAFKAQELKATITVVSSQVGTAVNPSVFRTLQTALNNFINNRKWTTDNFLPNEKIECNFLLNLDPTAETNVYNASLNHTGSTANL